MSLSEFDVDQLIRNLDMAIDDLFQKAELNSGDIIVVGCSTSEIMGEKIGKSSNLDLAQELLPVVLENFSEADLFPAFQCCEHLNRSLVIQEECQEKYDLVEVTVKPHSGAGGAMAAAAYQEFSRPVVVENIKARAGIDIGDTLIGMHLRPVAVPVRTRITSLGNAHLTFARTRPKLIGGKRAEYPEE